MLNMFRTPFHSKTMGLAILFISCLLFSPTIASSVPVEQTVSIRASIRGWTNQGITQQQLLQVLQAAYGYRGGHRTIPKVGSDYSLALYPVNATGCYRYIPENNSLVVYNLAVNKQTISTRFDQAYPPTADVLVIVVWNQSRLSNQYYASAEAGLLVQNTYLAAASIGLGTVCVGGIDSGGLRTDLSLPSTMIPLLVTPLGYPTSSYPSASPDYGRMTGNLPPVQYASQSFTEALDNMTYSQVWGQGTLSTQELSQLLWAAYGYSSTGHRTTPSAYDAYALRIFVSNATGVYQYLPDTHSVTQVVTGDKRLDLANACGGQTWAANAPALFLVVFDTAVTGPYGTDGGVVPHEYIETAAGTVMQQLLLEAAAWNLSGNILSQGLENWNGAGATAIRNILNLPSSLIPLYGVPIGHSGAIPEFPTSAVFAAIMVATTLVVVIYTVFSRRRR